LKPERWGPPFVQEKYRGEEACDRRRQTTTTTTTTMMMMMMMMIIIIIIIIIIRLPCYGTNKCEPTELYLIINRT